MIRALLARRRPLSGAVLLALTTITVLAAAAGSAPLLIASTVALGGTVVLTALLGAALALDRRARRRSENHVERLRATHAAVEAVSSAISIDRAAAAETLSRLETIRLELDGIVRR